MTDVKAFGLGLIIMIATIFNSAGGLKFLSSLFDSLNRIWNFHANLYQTIFVSLALGLEILSSVLYINSQKR